MNIYKFEHNVRGGETDWVCAPTIKEAREFYSSYTGINSFEETIVKKLTKKELEESQLLDVNESEPNWDEYEGDLTEDDFCNGYLITENFCEIFKNSQVYRYGGYNSVLIMKECNKFMKVLIKCGVSLEDLVDREWFIEEIEPHKYHCTGYHPTLLRMDIIKTNIFV